MLHRKVNLPCPEYISAVNCRQLGIMKSCGGCSQSVIHLPFMTTRLIICSLQVTILGRRPDDEILLLASDGLWDVLSNQEACTLAKRCLRRARQRGASRQSAARIAATVLTRAAVDRGSRDNVTVVVVDLASASAEAHALARAPSAAAAVGTEDSADTSLSAKSMSRSRSSFHHGSSRSQR